MFGIVLLGISIFSIFHVQSDGSYAIFVGIMFFLVGIFLFYRNLPRTDLTDKINKFTNKIYLGKLIFGGIFLAGSLFGLKYIIVDGSVDWVKLAIFAVFTFIVVKMLYKHFIK